MKKTMILGTLIIRVVFMSSPLHAADIAPLGFVLEKTTYLEALKAQPALKDIGVNKFSQGKMLNADGEHWSLKGLNNVTLIFNKNDRLTAVLMNLNKSRFDALLSHLSEKYQSTYKNIPFVGNKQVTFLHDGIEIDVVAPHLSFEMSVTYGTAAFNSAYRSLTRKEAETRRLQEGSLL